MRSKRNWGLKGEGCKEGVAEEGEAWGEMRRDRGREEEKGRDWRGRKAQKEIEEKKKKHIKLHLHAGTTVVRSQRVRESERPKKH